MRRWRLRSERGQTAGEYLGVIVLVAAIIAGLIAAGLPGTISGALDDAVCAVLQQGCDGGDEPDEPTAVDPQLTAPERTALIGDPEGAQDVLDSLSEAERQWLRENDPEAAAGMDEAISWKERREIVDQYIDSDLDDFLDYRDSEDRDERLDWSNDGCSAPLVGSSGISFDFLESCLRHDFGYRNYKELGIFEENKRAVDDRFLQDMKNHCATRSVLLQSRCYQWAYTFYYAVRAFG